MIRSTLMAGGGALAILTFFWLPAEYGIDPTGVGGLLGLTEMGEIKQQLAGEAAAQDAAPVAPAAGIASAAVPGEVVARLDRIDAQLAQIAAVIGADVATAPSAPDVTAPAAPAPEPEAVAEPAPTVVEPAEAPAPAVVADAPGWRDEVVFTLGPTEAKEIKLVMAAGDVANFEWVSEGGGVNYSQHGDDGGANEVRFEDGRAAPGQEGTMTAPFAGNHGWFWRNRGNEPITVTLRVGGAYAQMIEVE
ncbi:MAG: hypothetical protein B7Z02_16125 [Rhodobacterales bacterium 32-67-9]|nr:MAG: hypothetical protein B7Z02_16125 [Rhodobacterales bacterium 32-67-9]